MNKNKQLFSYDAPAIKVVTISTRRCIALSVDGGTESYSSSSEESQTEGFGYINQGDF